jgi:hypothetical protein
MAIRRTLKQKLKTEERRVEVSYQFNSTVPEKKSLVPPKKLEPDMFGYPVKFIYGDMMRTVIVAVLIVAVVVFLAISGRFS